LLVGFLFFVFLFEVNPAAFTPVLAGSLNNLSVQRSEVGDRAGALAAVEEAVALYRGLAEANPAAFTPDLARSTRLLADLAAAESPSDALAVWTGSAAVVPLAICRAEIWAAGAAWCASRGRTADAAALIQRAAGDASNPDEDTPSFVVPRARHQVRAVAMALDPSPPGLPAWTMRPVPDPDLELIHAWANAPSWPDAEAVLRAAPDVLAGDTLPGSLDVLLMLYPGNSDLEGLQQLVSLVGQDGVEPVLTRLGQQHATQQLVQDWIATPTWPASFAFLEEHRHELDTPEVRGTLTSSDHPVAGQHAAILTLAQVLPTQTVYECVTDSAAATDHALDALDRADLAQVLTVVQANPAILQEPGTGPTLLAVLLLVGGQSDQARQTLEAAASSLTDVPRRAQAIHLKRCADHADPDLAAALLPLIEALNAHPAEAINLDTGQELPIAGETPPADLDGV
jgi:hypothetical protein